MKNLKEIIENAIKVTKGADNPHIVNIPELKRALLMIADEIAEIKKRHYGQS